MTAAAEAETAATARPALPVSRAAFAEAYAAQPDSLRKIEEFAHANNLVVKKAAADRRTVVLQGSARQMSQAFGTRLEQYALPGGMNYRGRTGPIYLPADMADVVQAVLGLDNRPQAIPHFQKLTDLSRGNGLFGHHAAGTSFSPAEIATLYNFPASGPDGAPLDGRGQCVGIIELGGGYIDADLNKYFHDLKLPRPRVSAVSVDGARNRPGSAADGEVMLDIEVVGAVVPGADIVVYFAPNTSNGFLDAITTAIHDKRNKPSIISISWGAPESPQYWTQQAINAYNQAFRDASLLGVTICAAAGDSGSSDGVTDGRAHVDYPAADPYVLACGGTKIVVGAGAITSEVVWNEAPDSATGGGVSERFPAPIWQAGAGVPSSVNPGHFHGRGVPDVAGDADPLSGYRVRVDGHNEVIGGTSAVAPLWAGLFALINQALGVPVGYVNPLLYTAKVTQSYNPVIQGDNGDYRAGPGWDACTGLGSPDGVKLLAALTGP